MPRGDEPMNLGHFLAEDAALEPLYRTPLGALFGGDCLEILPALRSASVDTIFADPPFNLGKRYGRKTDDNLPREEYLDWCRAWIDQCVRILAQGGAFFIYNLPRWNIHLGLALEERGLEFRHWIAIDLGASLPIRGRLHPSHYSLIYYTKGKPKTFRRIRTPIQTCRHCGGEIKDYGGHRKALNPKGLNLKDIWTDIPPVRHAKFKSRGRKANALSTKLLDRVVEISTEPGDMVLDPFGGSGTTYAVCEAKHRRWLGVEQESMEIIIERLEEGGLEHHRNDDVIDP
jgi:site-specific DNA-methyltransferase (adenine-specific)